MLFKTNRLNYLLLAGILLVTSGLTLFLLIFFPVVREEASYLVRSKAISEIQPVNRDFSIVIPKIQANAPVISNINPYDASEYQMALTRGVAHASGTAYPGHAGNSFIFAHSSSDWYTANRYNSVFYLLHKLEKEDTIDIYYKGKKYTYEVLNKMLVSPNDISYLSPNINEGRSTLTLMTCWPPGTTLKRLLITAQLTKSFR